jgi:hypothetical protein
MEATTVQAAPEDVRVFILEYFDAWRGTDEDRRVASSNLARGAKSSLEFQKLTTTSPSLAFAVPAKRS